MWRSAIFSVLALSLATLAGNALAGGSRDACEDRCDERFVECESKAETKADDCARKIADDPAWIECDCGGVPGEGVRCAKVCEEAGRAVVKCEAKLEKRLDACFDKQSRCFDRCDD